MFVEYFMQSRAADCPRVVGVFVCESLEVKQSELHLTNYVPLKQKEINQVAYKLKSKSIFSDEWTFGEQTHPKYYFQFRTVSTTARRFSTDGVVLRSINGLLWTFQSMEGSIMPGARK